MSTYQNLILHFKAWLHFKFWVDKKLNINDEHLLFPKLADRNRIILIKLPGNL